MTTFGDSNPPVPAQSLLQESKSAEQRIAIKESIETPSAATEKLNNSIQLHKRLAVLCETYQNAFADASIADERLNSELASEEISEALYLKPSYLLTEDGRSIIVEIFEAARSIRSLENF